MADSDLENIKNNPQLNDVKTVPVVKKILTKNNKKADEIRKYFEDNDITVINLMSSPGSGKTTLLEHLSEIADFRFGVIEGDLETNRDAQRLRDKGVVSIQIQTGSACHLDAFMVEKGVANLPIDGLEVCFIENVGNLVCPASYDVGAHYNIVLVSIPEGESKVEKYPVMFRKADLVLFTKVDLLPYFEYDLEKEKEAVKRLKPDADILEVSIKDKESLKKVAKWINKKLKKESV